MFLACFCRQPAVKAHNSAVGSYESRLLVTARQLTELGIAEAGELISRASGLPITYRRITASEYTAALLDQGLDPGAAHNVSQMFVMLDRGELTATTEDVNTVLGRSPATFEDYVVRAAAAGAWRR